MGSSSIRTGVLGRREDTEVDTQEEDHHVKTVAETGVMQLKVKGHRSLPAKTRN